MDSVAQLAALYTQYRALPHTEDALRNCNMILEAELDVLINTMCGEEEVEHGRQDDVHAWNAGVRIQMGDLEEADNVQRRVIIALQRCPLTPAFELLIDGAGLDLFECLDVLDEE